MVTALTLIIILLSIVDIFIVVADCGKNYLETFSKLFYTKSYVVYIPMQYCNDVMLCVRQSNETYIKM